MTVAVAAPRTAARRAQSLAFAVVSKGLPLLLLLALVRGLVWTLALPPWYGPDEPSHFMYTQLIAEEGRFPSYGSQPDGRDNPPEVLCSEYNLGWRITGPFYSEPLWNGDAKPCTYPRTTANRRPEILTNPAGGYSPLYYVLGVPFYEVAYSLPVEDRLHAVRLLSVILGVLATWFCFRAAQAAFRRRHLAVAATTIFTLQPMASQQFALANNDALLLAAAAFFFWRLFKSLRDPLTRVDVVLLGAAVGVAYLAKPQGVFLGALLPLTLWVAWKRSGGDRRSLLVVAAGLAGVAATLLVAGLLVNLAIHGSLFPQGTRPPAGQHFSAKGYYELHAATRFARLYWLWITGFWGYFGWFSIALPLGALYSLVGVQLAAAAGLVVAFVGRRFDRPVLVTAVLGVLLVAVLTQILEIYFFRQTGALILQGRSFLPVLPAAAIALTAGLAALVPLQGERPAAAVITAAALTLNVGALMVLLEGFFG